MKPVRVVINGAKGRMGQMLIACAAENPGLSIGAAVDVGDDFAADMEPAISLGMHAVWKSTFTSPEVAFCSDQLNEIRVHLLQEA